jgi:hypothetical protein
MQDNPPMSQPAQVEMQQLLEHPVATGGDRG